MNRYTLHFKPRVEKDMRALSREDRELILTAIERLSVDLQGDVKQLTDFTPEYRLRVGSYRVLFEIVDSTIVVYRVLHRREAYR
ncbi:MAG: type II toxin-antitoxin system RelE/ParE family toxin [Candidatus Competibacteraceae bacterium]|nr:MAG: type II toxin-antitoxin system RelE/ParE family toxin [Candidatus Competibacteraceae bacterium]